MWLFCIHNKTKLRNSERKLERETYELCLHKSYERGKEYIRETCRPLQVLIPRHKKDRFKIIQFYGHFI